MALIEADVEQIKQEATVRRAQVRLAKIDDVRAAVRLAAAGKSQREIEGILGLSQATVSRMLAAASHSGESTEIEARILRAAVDPAVDRHALVDDLARRTYTFGQMAPDGMDGRVGGTWDTVTSLWIGGFLSDDEYDAVERAVRPPSYA